MCSQEQGKNRIQAVLFDLDGVLIDTEKHLVRYWCQAAQEFGFEMKREHGLLIRSLAGKYAEPLLQEIFGKNFDYQKIRNRRKELMEEQLLLHGIEKKPGVDMILDYLKKQKIKTAVVTATDEERAECYLKQVKIKEKFDKIICATMVENGKPMPDVYQYACKEIGERPEDCMAVEDSPNGVKSAYGAGIKTVMVPDLSQPDLEIEGLLFGKINDLRELTKFINQRN